VPTSSDVIRSAVRADVDTLVDFTLQEARDAEGVELDAMAVRRGVLAAFAENPRATYWVAEDSEQRLVGSISILTEWSNFRGGDYWWIQSLYIAPEHRGTGLLDRLIEHVTNEARNAGALDLRLYAYENNERALRAYRRLGFSKRAYVMMSRPVR
jgi:ribosomal protein S18 acetylase RimI-like enzyme